MKTPVKFTYTTTTALRQALEGRLANISKEQGIDIQRLRRQVAFDRLLCRLFLDPQAPWILKGGYAMELRLTESRTTRDIDLGMRKPMDGSGSIAERMLALLQKEAGADIGDFFIFTIGQAMMDIEAAPYGGARFPVEARLDGRIFARFHLDVASGDVVIDPSEVVRGHDWFDFCGVPPGSFPAIPKEQQFAEKLHAYTLPRGDQINMRFRDLLDMVLLIRLGLNNGKTRMAIHRTFDRRDTHLMPDKLTLPPEAWKRPFAMLAAGCSVTLDYLAAFENVSAFLQTLVLNRPTQPAVDKLWADEAERRVAQIDSGEVELIPGETVFE